MNFLQYPYQYPTIDPYTQHWIMQSQSTPPQEFPSDTLCPPLCPLLKTPEDQFLIQLVNQQKANSLGILTDEFNPHSIHINDNPLLTKLLEAAGQIPLATATLQDQLTPIQEKIEELFPGVWQQIQMPSNIYSQGLVPNTIKLKEFLEGIQIALLNKNLIKWSSTFRVSGTSKEVLYWSNHVEKITKDLLGDNFVLTDFPQSLSVLRLFLPSHSNPQDIQKCFKKLLTDGLNEIDTYVQIETVSDHCLIRCGNWNGIVLEIIIGKDPYPNELELTIGSFISQKHGYQFILNAKSYSNPYPTQVISDLCIKRMNNNGDGAPLTWDKVLIEMQAGKRFLEKDLLFQLIEVKNRLTPTQQATQLSETLKREKIDVQGAYAILIMVLLYQVPIPNVSVEDLFLFTREFIKLNPINIEKTEIGPFEKWVIQFSKQFLSESNPTEELKDFVMFLSIIPVFGWISTNHQNSLVNFVQFEDGPALQYCIPNSTSRFWIFSYSIENPLNYLMNPDIFKKTFFGEMVSSLSHLFLGYQEIKSNQIIFDSKVAKLLLNNVVHDNTPSYCYFILLLRSVCETDVKPPLNIFLSEVFQAILFARSQKEYISIPYDCIRRFYPETFKNLSSLEEVYYNSAISKETFYSQCIETLIFNNTKEEYITCVHLLRKYKGKNVLNLHYTLLKKCILHHHWDLATLELANIRKKISFIITHKDFENILETVSKTQLNDSHQLPYFLNECRFIANLLYQNKSFINERSSQLLSCLNHSLRAFSIPELSFPIEIEEPLKTESNNVLLGKCFELAHQKNWKVIIHLFSSDAHGTIAKNKYTEEAMEAGKGLISHLLDLKLMDDAEYFQCLMQLFYYLKLNDSTYWERFAELVDLKNNPEISHEFIVKLDTLERINNFSPPTQALKKCWSISVKDPNKFSDVILERYLFESVNKYLTKNFLKKHKESLFLQAWNVFKFPNNMINFSERFKELPEAIQNKHVNIRQEIESLQQLHKENTQTEVIELFDLSDSKNNDKFIKYFEDFYINVDKWDELKSFFTVDPMIQVGGQENHPSFVKSLIIHIYTNQKSNLIALQTIRDIYEYYKFNDLSLNINIRREISKLESAKRWENPYF